MSLTKKRGFTLFEVVLVLVLLIIVIALGAPQVKGEKERADSRALAMKLAEEMRQARQRAMGQQIPVGVAFPSEDSTKAHTQSCYFLEGETPKVTRVIDYSKEYPGIYIFNGFWELDPPKLRDSSKLNTTAQPRTGSQYDKSPRI